jgi:hypothetical protein
MACRYEVLLPRTTSLRLFIRRLRQSRTASNYRVPASRRLLRHILADHSIHIGIRAAISLAYGALLRVSEYTSPSQSRFSPTATLQRHHVAVASDNTFIRILIPSSKTDTLNLGQHVHVAYDPHRLSTFSVLTEYLRFTDSAPPATPTPLFYFTKPNGTVRFVTGQVINTTLKTAATALGIDPTFISSHSLRIAGARALADARLPAHIIQVAGRWASDVYIRYIRASLPRLQAVAKALRLTRQQH